VSSAVAPDGPRAVARRKLPTTTPWMPLAGAALAIATIAVGLGFRFGGGDLGAPLPPFLWRAVPAISIWAVPAVVLLVVVALQAERLVDLSRSAAGFATGSFALAIGLRLALAAARDGPGDWWQVFVVAPQGEGRHEYLPTRHALDGGAGSLLDHFDRIAPTLPVHPSAHPPGLLLVDHWLGITTPQALAALVIGVGALSAPLVYALARSLLDESRARVATLLYVLAPGSLLYGATSADALFATAALAAAVLLTRDGLRWRALGAAALALASFLSYALVAAGTWAVLVRGRRRGVRDAVTTAALCAVALVGFYAALAALAGFDLPAVLNSANDAYRRGVADRRPYEFWVIGSPVAFGMSMGVPLAWLWLRGAGRREAAAVALLAVVAIAAVAGFSKAETERIWLFLVPFACLAAALELPRNRLRAVALALVAQALVVELVFFTIW